MTPQLDPSLRDLVERIIPLATYYTSISTFVELRSHLDYGLVNHALCAAIRDMLKVSYSFLPALLSMLTVIPGLSNALISARACIQLLRDFYPPEALVLHSSNSSHNVSHLYSGH